MLSRSHIFKGHLVCAGESCQDPSLLPRYGVPPGVCAGSLTGNRKAGASVHSGPDWDSG